MTYGACICGPTCQCPSCKQQYHGYGAYGAGIAPYQVLADVADSPDPLVKRHYSGRVSVEEAIALLNALVLAKHVSGSGWTEPIPYIAFTPQEQEAFTSVIDPWADDPSVNDFTIYDYLVSQNIMGRDPNEDESYRRIIPFQTPGWNAARIAEYAARGGKRTFALWAWNRYPSRRAPHYVFEGEHTTSSGLRMRPFMKGGREYGSYGNQEGYDGTKHLIRIGLGMAIVVGILAFGKK